VKEHNDPGPEVTMRRHECVHSPRRSIAALVTLASLLLLASCSSPAGDRSLATAGRATPLAPRLAMESDIAAATDAQENVSRVVLDLPGVVGTGVGRDARGQAMIVVLVERAGLKGIPVLADGYRVATEVVGPLRGFALTGRYRPVPIGVSTGNAIECLPGTIGCVLESAGKRYLLTANHVFARQNLGTIGEVVAQPSLPDADPTCASSPIRNKVARLADFEPVVYDSQTPNLMDAAIAELTTTDYSCATLPAFYGLPSSQAASPVAGAAILKVGRTTELTRGSIKAINVKVKITFPAGTALFVDQILTSKGFGAFGDSGALAVTDDGVFHPVGIVIGGGSNGTAILSPIGPILQRFAATVCGS
jgi:hypothetical protein